VLVLVKLPVVRSASVALRVWCLVVLDVLSQSLGCDEPNNGFRVW
jgi:hypothetical protein